jgi:hypothetical protein
MHLPPLVPLLIFIAVILVIWWVTVRFSPDPLITKIVQVVLFIVVIIKMLGLLGIS